MASYEFILPLDPRPGEPGELFQCCRGPGSNHGREESQQLLTPRYSWPYVRREHFLRHDSLPGWPAGHRFP
eukprot:16359353-Heterocapsa_arctica.AAC.1